MGSAQSASATQLTMPSRAEVRSSAEHFWAWVTGSHAPPVKTPTQETGTASGPSHQVPAAITRAGRGSGHAPGRGPGQLPAYAVHGPQARTFVTGPAPGRDTFSPATSKIVTSSSTATSDLYRNADGSYTRHVYASPVNYQTSSGAWAPIDTGLAGGTDGRWHERANSLAVSFAPRADNPTLGSVAFGNANAASSGLSFGLAGAAAVTGTAAGPQVTYPGVLPNTDLIEMDTAVGVNESMVLRSAQAPSTWIFPLHLTGLKPVMESGGSVGLIDSSGKVDGVIPHGSATDAHVNTHTGVQGATSGVTYSLVTYQGAPALQVSLDRAWLDDPRRAFPVTVDPSVNDATKGTTYVLYPYNNDYSGETDLQVGTYNGGTNYARAFLDFTGLGASLQYEHVTAATLHLFDQWAYYCGSAETNGVYQVTSSWTASGNKTWPGPSTGTEIGSVDTTAPSAACSNTSGNPNVGGWINVPFNGNGINLLNSWTLGRGANYGFEVGASYTDSYAYKKFDSLNTYQAPYVSVTYTDDVPPQIDSQYPPDNYNTTTLTPELLASGSDSDNWPDPVKYDFTVYNSSGTKVVDSGLVSSGDWSVPKGDLLWGQTYYWTVQDYDGLDYSATPQVNYFSTPVPQPLITSGLSQNASGPGFEPATGNYTTTATDAQVSTVGPALSVVRDYNSHDPRSDGAFGAGWSSILDMQAAPGQVDPVSGVTQTVVVTYPDGQEVGFGANPNGSFTPPQGRFATFASVSGGYTLTDKNDTVYKFTQPLGSGAYGITSVTDALGHALTFTYNSSGQVTTVTSAASGRALHLTWTTPSAPASAHVASVATDPVTAGNSATALTWTYNYSGDQLNSVCPPASTTACTTYTYTPGSHYQDAVLGSGPHSYWRLDETSGSTAASSVLANEGTDNSTYSGVSLSQAGPLPGSAATSAGFNGTSSYVRLPGGLVSGASYQSLSVWFKTTTAGGVIFSSSADPITSSTTAGRYTPSLYIGWGGDLNAEFWNGTASPMLSNGPVNDGKWHLAVLTAAGDTQTLYVDGKQHDTKSGTVSMLHPQDNAYTGAGFLGGAWPNEPHQSSSSNTGYPSYFNGNISDVALWDRPLTSAEISAMYTAGTHQASLVTKVTRPTGNVYAQVAYNGLNGAVTSVTDGNGGNWSLGAPSVTGSSQVYVSSVLGAAPADYWRLGDTGTTQAVNQVNGGTATYSSVTQGVSGPFSDTTADQFNGSSSYASLPPGLVTGQGNQSISLWFKTTTAGGVIFSSSADPITNGTSAQRYTSELYLGSGGDLNAEFWNGTANPMLSSGSLNDGKWHNVVLATGTTSQVLYVDGQQAATLSGTIGGTGQNNVYLGAGFLGGAWPHEPHQSSSSNTGYATYFSGSIGDVAFYNHQLTAAQITDEYNASKHSSGLTPAEKVQVTDPVGKVMSYTYDPLNGNRVLSQTDALGNPTKYGYDTSGFVNTVTDPDGNVTTTGHDVRGNMVSQTGCQQQAAGQCSTTYYSYYPNDTAASLTPDPRNDMVVAERDGRSSSATDNKYLTTYSYNAQGELTGQTTPPVPGFPSGRSTTTSYTDGTTVAAVDSGYAPVGLPYKVTTPGGATTTTLYYNDGEIAQTTDPDGLVTKFTYDGVGRVLTKTVVSDIYPAGLTTSYAYNQMGQVVAETDPAVTDRVTGASHTAQISTTYDADGDVTGQTVADTTGGDASRSVSYTYDSHDLLATSTNTTGAVTKYSYDAYGDLASHTDPAANVTDYAHDANGRLLTTTLENYTGGPANPSAPASLVESSRTYDPAGRLASVTDSMGWVTSYTYTDDGLTASITRSDPHTGASFTEQSNSYDAAGNLISRAVNNGATTTTYAVDAANRTASQTLDPSGLNRTTSFSYSPDDQVVNQTLTGSGSSAPVRSTSYTYDPMGNMTSQSAALQGGGDPTSWWRLDQTSGTTVPDASGTGHQATATGVSWSGGAASFAGASGQQIATSGPVLDTTGSYSVSAWVNLSSTSGWQTIVGQDGSTNSGFNLQLDSTTGHWNFAHNNTDSQSTAITRAESASAATAGTWTHLVGIYDNSSGTLTLYVNGQSSGSATTTTTPWHATGPLTIGRGLWDGAPADLVNGQVSDVQVYQRVLSASEISALYKGGRDGGANPANQLTTSWALDQRGLPTSMTDPNMNVTHYAYDEAGRQAVTTDPTVTTQVYGGSAAPTAPVTMTGYDTFGNPVENSDANGNVTTTGYDAAGRAVSVTAPPYTPPGGSQITPVSTKTYNSLGQVTAETDPLGNKATYTYDQLSDVATTTAPDAGVTHYTYDTNGDQLSVTGPTGAVTQSTYDYLGRKLTSTQIERSPSAASYTTSYTYGNGGWLSSQTSPDSVATAYTYNAAGQTASVTDGAQNKTGYGYDAAGNVTSTINPDGTSTTATFDGAGRQVAQADLSGTGAVLRSQSAGYDGNGNLTSATDYRGNTTTYSYDATGMVTQEVQPVTASSGITTSFGYDAAGNRTLYTDGNGHQWWTTYNSLNLPESTIEPATSAYSTAADGTFTTAYNAAGQPVSQTQPGGVTITDSYNNMGDLTGQSGAGASAATTARSFSYDQAGNMTSASAPGGNDTFTYNDRGLLLSASGPSGSSSFSYNGDGQVGSVSDAAGTTSYGYDTAGRLATLNDPATGTTASYSYTPNSQVSQIAYGSGNDTRSFGYNGLHQLTSDTLKTGSAQTVASIGYGYDPNGNLTSKTTTGFAGSASNTYAYDAANRLTSWNNGTTTVNYGYDGVGNRTQAGNTTYTYDARDQLTSDSTNSYSYTANGTLASEMTPTGTVNSTSDAFGQAITQGTQTYAYDALGRVASDTGSSGTASFSYSGSGSTLASDGTWNYTWDPTGTSLAGVGVAGGTASQGTIAYTDAHSDVVGGFTASGSSLSGSSTYDPLGNVVSSSGLSGRLGYQSSWTDPTTKNVDMGARWYNPSVGQFQNRDTASVNPVGNSAAANPFAYVGDNPLGATDPTGHMLCSDYVCGSAQFLSHYHYHASAPAYRAPPRPAPSCSGWFSCGWHAVASGFDTVRHAAASAYDWTRHTVASAGDYVYRRYIHPAVTYLVDKAKAVAREGAAVARSTVHDASTAVSDAAAWGAHAAVAAYHTVAQAGSRAYHAVTRWAHTAYTKVSHAVSTAYHAVAKAATATVAFIKHHAAAIASVVVSTVVFAGCDLALGAATGGVGAIAGAAACGALAGAVGGAVSYGITAAQTGKFSLAGLGTAALGGALVGGATLGIMKGAGGLLGGLLRSGAEDAASALSSRTADEAASVTTESAATTADSTGQAAAQDAVARSGGTASPRDATGPSCGGMSFTAGTKVLTVSGGLVAISKLAKGQKVVATDTKTGKDQAEPVAAVLVHHDTNLYDLKVRAGHRTAVIATTSNHLFWDATSRRWVKAAALRYGTRLRTPVGQSAMVVGGWVPGVHTGWMWDLTVTRDHDFYVQVGPGNHRSGTYYAVLVHNCDIRLTQRQADTLQPGPSAADSVPATGPVITPAQSRAMQGLACHTCGAADPEATMFADHQPPGGFTSPGTEQNLYPQCGQCSGDQARAVQLAQQMLRNHGYYDPTFPGMPGIPSALEKLAELLPGHIQG
jgi:RHS repeat-associated protein